MKSVRRPGSNKILRDHFFHPEMNQQAGTHDLWRLPLGLPDLVGACVETRLLLSVSISRPMPVDEIGNRTRLRDAIACLPFHSTVCAPARSAIARWASGKIILSSVATRYQLGLDFHAGSETVPPRAPSPREPGIRHEGGHVGIGVTGKRGRELRAIQHKKAVGRKQDRRHGRAWSRENYDGVHRRTPIAHRIPAI